MLHNQVLTTLTAFFCAVDLGDSVPMLSHLARRSTTPEAAGMSD